MYSLLVLKTFWVKDLRLKYCSISNGDERWSFELIVNRGRNRARSVVLFTCESDSLWKQLVEDLESTLLAYHRQTEYSKVVGWFHDIIQGNIFSAAYLGDIVELRRHIRLLAQFNQSKGASFLSPDAVLNEPDLTGMTALHWSALRGHEVCVRLLLDKGADVDVLQKGMNSPLLLAAAGGHESVARLLLERGADITLRNVKGHDSVFMAVLYGHATKGLPWLLQLLTHRGVNLNQVDSCGATPLHLCAEKNLARPVRMLVDAGAEVNAKYGQFQWSPLQLACKHKTPDVETIRSFLDKGAYPNWRDLNGKTAFEIALSMQPSSTNSGQSGLSRAPSDKRITVESSDEGTSSANRYQLEESPDKWRAMDETLSQVGDWAVRALPALLELCRKGARFEQRDVDFLRQSFRSAIQEGRDVWLTKSAPANFKDFVVAREQAGEELLLHKGVWHKDNASSACPLCSDTFGLTNRRHHCRACGVLCCDKCSSKRLQLSFNETLTEVTSPGPNGGPKEERVCDGCFNRLIHEASQPSPDHFRVRQLKQSALDVIQSIEELIEALDDPFSDQSSSREPNTREMSKMSFSGTITSLSGMSSSTTTSNLSRSTVLTHSPSFRGRRPSLVMTESSSTPTAASQTSLSSRSTGDLLIEALKIRESKLYHTEDVIAKFLEAADGYHRVSKKLIDQKSESRRLWGSGGVSS